MNKNYVFVLLIFFITMLFVSSMALDKKADSIINDVVKKYEKSKNMKINFSQHYYWKLTDNVSEQNGTIWLEGKDKFKIKTENQTIVSNGEIVWTYSKTNNQVLIDNVAQADDIKLPRDILLDFKKDYQPVYINEHTLEKNKCHLIQLRPESGDSFIKEIRVWIDVKKRIVRQIEQTDLNNNINTYALSDIEFDIPLESDFFVYNIPDSVEVIDMR